jgi:hypothetical protein
MCFCLWYVYYHPAGSHHQHRPTCKNRLACIINELWRTTETIFGKSNQKFRYTKRVRTSVKTVSTWNFITAITEVSSVSLYFLRCKYILLPPSPVIMQMCIGDSSYAQTINTVQSTVCFYFASLKRFFCDTLLETAFTQGNAERDTLYNCETISHLTSDATICSRVQRTKFQMCQILIKN